MRPEAKLMPIPSGGASLAVLDALIVDASHAAPSTVVARNRAAVTPARAAHRLFMFVVLLLLLACGIHMVITTGLRRIKTSAFGASNQIMEGRVNAQVVITGSSRALLQYDPRIIQSITGRSAFNLGRNGSQTDMQVAFFKAYLAHNRKPEIVIHNLDAFSFVTTRTIFDPAQYMPYLYDRDLYEASRKINPQTWRSRYVPLYGYVVEDMNLTWTKGVAGFFGWSPRQDYFLGFNPRHVQWTGDFENFEKSHPRGVTFDIEPAGVRDLEDLIMTCKENGIQLIFVYSPEYDRMQAMTRNREQIFAQFHQLADRYDIPLWDYSNWSHSEDKSLFYNSQHLNAEGAEIFSADVAHRLQQLLAKRAASPVAGGR
jgi:hypothetical protein